MNVKNDEAIKYLNNLKKDISKICDTPEGIRVFRHFALSSGMFKSSIVLNKESHEINLNSTVYNEARRNLYLEFRTLFERKHLIKIEYGD